MHRQDNKGDQEPFLVHKRGGAGCCCAQGFFQVEAVGSHLAASSTWLPGDTHVRARPPTWVVGKGEKEDIETVLKGDDPTAAEAHRQIQDESKCEKR